MTTVKKNAHDKFVHVLDVARGSAFRACKQNSTVIVKRMTNRIASGLTDRTWLRRLTSRIAPGLPGRCALTMFMVTRVHYW